MDVFFSDLDNTLVFSHRHKPDGELILAERLDGKEQAYVTRNTYEFIYDNVWLNLIPVTTRTIEQFKRITLFNDYERFQYALVCNGAILLNKGIVDDLWLEETKKLSFSELPEIEKASELLKEYCNNIHFVEDLFVYIKSNRVFEILDSIKGKLDLRKVSVYVSGEKLYCIPNTITKGNAIKRFSNRFNINMKISAGDSVLDVDMP